MVIVSVTRGDLRDEFLMADDAFALSPIAARATQPREEDYDAIREAFMETSRGRWFLGEYAKRNRNADTRMVLDAVARLEENLATQRQMPPDNGLAEALVAIRKAVGEARAAASVAIDSLALEQTLVPVRKGARVIREIAWRWREIGADGRICDLLDQQVNAIEASCGQITSIDPSSALSAAFDLIEQQIAQLGEGDSASPQATEAAVKSPSPSSSLARSDDTPAADLDMVQVAAGENNSEAADSTPAMPADAAVAAEERLEVTAESLEAHDDAVLDMVALEMAAPGPFDIDDPFDTGLDEIHLGEKPPVHPQIIVREPAPAPVVRPSLPATSEREPEPALQPSAEPALQPSPEASLGSALIANGILRKSNAAETDSLTPIRRMSQAEKVAFFS